MMIAAARWIWTRAKKESDLEEPDLSHGWRIDLKVRNKVERIEEGEDKEDVIVSVKGKEKEKTKKRKKKLKKVSSKKQKRGGRKEALSTSCCDPTLTDTHHISS